MVLIKYAWLSFNDCEALRHGVKKKKKWDVVIWINVIITRWLLCLKHDKQNIAVHSAEPANDSSAKHTATVCF